MVDFNALIRHLRASDEPFGLLSMQATSTCERLASEFPGRMKCLFSAEHGFFGKAAAGEHTHSMWHPYWNMPIHSLYGETRRPTDEMLQGLGRIVIDLQDIGVRCYTYLATLKNMLEECAKRNIPVTLVDRPIPLGGIVDGPMCKPAFASFVAPINVPLCHGMTPGECATWIVREEGLKLDLTVIKMIDWNHKFRDAWMNFVPPSPAIKSWDSAALYPLTVFSEAFPALNCDRDGPLAFRVMGAPWMNHKHLIDDLRPALSPCGVAVRPYRYSPITGQYAGMELNGMLFSIDNPEAYYPVTAGTLVLTALLQHHSDKIMHDARPEWLDKLAGSTDIRDTFDHGDLDGLFQSWIDSQDAYLATKVDLYQ